MFNDPVMLHGSSISYFTGKMENYFRVRGIPYKRIVGPYPVSYTHLRAHEDATLSRMPSSA